jgi:hypothetical protein
MIRDMIVEIGNIFGIPKVSPILLILGEIPIKMRG